MPNNVAYTIETVLNCHHEDRDDVEDMGYKLFDNNAEWFQAWKQMGDYNTIMQIEEYIVNSDEIAVHYGKPKIQYQRALGNIKQFSQQAIVKGITVKNLLYIAEIFEFMRCKFDNSFNSVSSKPSAEYKGLEKHHLAYLQEMYRTQCSRFYVLNQVALHLANKINNFTNI